MESQNPPIDKPPQRRSALWKLGVFGVILILGYNGIRLVNATRRYQARAAYLSCSFNLRQISLAARVYAEDHGNRFPPDFAAMQKQLGTLRTLACSVDRANPIHKATNWNQVKQSESSYEYMAADFSLDSRVQWCVKCKLHGWMCDTDAHLFGPDPL